MTGKLKYLALALVAYALVGGPAAEAAEFNLKIANVVPAPAPVPTPCSSRS